MAKRIPDELTGISTGMAGLLFAEHTLASALGHAMLLAQEAIPGTAGAGVTLIRDSKMVTAAYSDDVVRRADAMQYVINEGPCLSAALDRRTYRIDSMLTEERWPRWAAEAAAMGMMSSLSVPLVVRHQGLGAVKVYSTNSAAYDDRAEHMLSMFAEHSAVVLVNMQAYVSAQELGDQLSDALKSRRMIGEAMGMLMEREGIDEEAAFGMLRRASQSHNVKLREIAREIVQSQQHPTR